MMEKIKHSPFLAILLSVFFTLLLADFAYTYSVDQDSISKDMFNMFLTEYRADTDRMFKFLEGLKK